MKLFEYIRYLITTIRFNHFYRWFHGSQISLFDNCSYIAYKQKTLKETDN